MVDPLVATHADNNVARVTNSNIENVDWNVHVDSNIAIDFMDTNNVENVADITIDQIKASPISCNQPNPRRST